MDQVMNKVGSNWFNQKAAGQQGVQLRRRRTQRKMQKPPARPSKRVWIARRNISPTNCEFNEETTVSACEVGYKDSSVLRFSTAVTGYLEKGKLVDIDGMKTTRNREAYEVLRDWGGSGQVLEARMSM